MTFSKWMSLFIKTLGVGAVFGLIAGVLLQAMDPDFSWGGLSGIGFNVGQMLLAGAMFSILSQMGFFAYLTLNYIARSIFRKPSGWQLVQVALTIFVLLYTASFPFWYLNTNANEGFYIGYSLLMLLIGAGVGYWKVQLTNAKAWIPTVFFISAVTTLETIPALQQNAAAPVVFMTIPLIACNAYQILILGRLVSTPKSPS